MGARGRVGEEDEAVDGDGDGDEAVDAKGVLVLIACQVHRYIARLEFHEPPRIMASEIRETALHEQPPPAAEPVLIVQRGLDARLDVPANERAGEPRRGEDAGALAELALRVPGAEDVVRADESRGLGDALEEADGGDALRVVHRGGDHGQAGPHEHAGREEDARPHEVQRQVRGDLAHDVARREGGLDLRQLVADEAELLLHARDVGIVEVGAVELVVVV